MAGPQDTSPSVTETMYLISNSWVEELKSFILSAGSLPSGSIIMYHGATIPSGWALCNGQNGTPDLRDKFIVGAGNSYAEGSYGQQTNKTMDDPLIVSGTTSTIPVGLSYYALYYIMKT